MQDGADIDHVHFFARRTERQHGTLQPAVQLVALRRAEYLLVVFEVVEDNQIGTIGAVAQAAQLFTAACHLHLNIVAGDDGARLPHAPAACHLRKINGKARIGGKLGFDGFQHRVCLIDTLHHQQDVALATSDDAVEGIELGHDGGFCFATRRSNGVQLAAWRGEDAW